MLTGLYPSKTGVMGNVGKAGGDNLQIPTIGSYLQEAGYYTGYFGKWHLGDNPAGMGGWDEQFGIDGSHLAGDDEEVSRRGTDFLEKHRDGPKPFALFLSYNNPHDIYHFSREETPEPRTKVELPRTWHEKKLSETPDVQQQFMDEDQGKVIVNCEAPAWQRYRELYREKVELYDIEVGRIMSFIEEHGLTEDTLLVVTSDHGDMDGQHRLIYKGPFMYEHMIRVPLMIKLPENHVHDKMQKNIDFPTVNVDLVPTLADFANAEVPDNDGVSLRPLLTGEDAPSEREFVIVQYYSKQSWVNPIRTIRTQRYKYNLYLLHGEELYDLEKDPEEIQNLAGNKEYADIQAGLARRLDQWMEKNDDPFYSLEPTDREGKPLSSK